MGNDKALVQVESEILACQKHILYTPVGYMTATGNQLVQLPQLACPHTSACANSLSIGF